MQPRRSLFTVVKSARPRSASRRTTAGCPRYLILSAVFRHTTSGYEARLQSQHRDWRQPETETASRRCVDGWPPASSGSPPNAEPRPVQVRPGSLCFLLVQNLPPSVSAATLNDLFGQFGCVLNVLLKTSLTSPGRASIKMRNREEAEAAIAETHGAEIDGWVISVVKIEETALPSLSQHAAARASPPAPKPLAKKEASILSLFAAARAILRTKEDPSAPQDPPQSKSLLFWMKRLNPKPSDKQPASPDPSPPANSRRAAVPGWRLEDGGPPYC